MRTPQQQPEKARCFHCEAKVPTSLLQSHEQQCCKERRFECDLCQRRFKSPVGVNIHKGSVHSAEDLHTQYNCSNCDFGTNSPALLKQHMSRNKCARRRSRSRSRSRSRATVYQQPDDEQQPPPPMVDNNNDDDGGGGGGHGQQQKAGFGGGGGGRNHRSRSRSRGPAQAQRNEQPNEEHHQMDHDGGQQTESNESLQSQGIGSVSAAPPRDNKDVAIQVNLPAEKTTERPSAPRAQQPSAPVPVHQVGTSDTPAPAMNINNALGFDYGAGMAFLRQFEDHLNAQMMSIKKRNEQLRDRARQHGIPLLGDVIGDMIRKYEDEFMKPTESRGDGAGGNGGGHRGSGMNA